MSRIKLSVITVVMNAASTIDRTIKSVIKQKTSNIEYIVIDGGSKDGTTNIIKKYIEYIDLFIQEPDKGLYDAMNKGIMNSSGEFISFINADDWYEEKAFSVMAESIDKEVDIAYGLVGCVVDGKDEGYIGISEETDQDRLMIGNLYCHQGLFINRRVFNVIGTYDLQYRTFADYEWNLRANHFGYIFKLIPIKVSNFTAGGLSSLDTLSNRKETIDIIEKYINDDNRFKEEALLLQKRRIEKLRYLYLEKYKKNSINVKFDRRYGYYIWGAGNNGKSCLDLLRFNNVRIVGFIDNNKNLSKICDFKVYHPSEILQDVIYKGIVVVTPINHEEEIRKYLEHIGVRSDRIYTFSELKKKIVDTFSEDEWTEMLERLDG